MRKSRTGNGNTRVTTNHGSYTKDVTYGKRGTTTVDIHRGGHSRSYSGVTGIHGYVTPTRRKR